MLAQQSAHPYSRSFALSAVAISISSVARHVGRRNAPKQPPASPRNRDFRTGGQGAILRGWALVQQGQAQEGIKQLHQGLTTYRATGAEILQPYFLALLADAHGTMEQPEAGLTALRGSADAHGHNW